MNAIEQLLREAAEQEEIEWMNAAGLAWALAKYVPNGEFTLNKEDYVAAFGTGEIKRYLHGKWNEDRTACTLHLDSSMERCDRDAPLPN